MNQKPDFTWHARNAFSEYATSKLAENFCKKLFYIITTLRNVRIGCHTSVMNSQLKFERAAMLFKSEQALLHHRVGTYRGLTSAGKL
jgi:hypothetical protein